MGQKRRHHSHRSVETSFLHASICSGSSIKAGFGGENGSSKATEEPVFIFLDELNKYAPRTEGGAMVKLFRDVAERGRSFGVILVGAEQTASQVDFRVVTQSSTTMKRIIIGCLLLLTLSLGMMGCSTTQIGIPANYRYCYATQIIQTTKNS